MNLKLFKNRNFSLFVFGQSTSIFGTIFLNIALALYVLKTTGSAAQFSSILALGVLPSAILGPFAGAVVDKLDRKKFIVFLDFLCGLFLLGLFIFSLKYQIQMGLIYVMAIFFALCDLFYSPVFTIILPSIVKPEELVSANSLQMVIQEVAKILAPMLGTLLYGIYGLGIIILVDGITYLLSALSEVFMVFDSAPAFKEKSTIFKDVWDGFKVLKDKRLISLVTNGLLTHLFLFPFIMVGFPYMIINVFNGASIDYGIVESVSTIATLLAMIIVPIVHKRFNIAQGLGIGILAMLVPVLMLLGLGHDGFVGLLSNVSKLPVLFFSIFMFLFSLAFTVYGVFFLSFYQTNVPRELLGRFVGLLGMIFAFGRIIGLKVYGYLFTGNNLLLPVAIITVGMILKLVVHIPFLKVTKKLELADKIQA